MSDEQFCDQARVRRARNGVAAAFIMCGYAFASWTSHIPEVRDTLGLTPSRLGVLLLASSIGAFLAMPLSGILIHRFGVARVVLGGAVLDAVGVALIGIGMGVAVWLTAIALFAFGLGTGVWGVSMNVEGTSVERAMGRSIMPRFHAGFSLGTVAGAAGGAGAAALGIPAATHLMVVAVLVVVVMSRSTAGFLPAGVSSQEQGPSATGRSQRAWVEPRTLAIGVLVLVMTLAEGTANDWLAVALVDGHKVPHWLGSTGFAVFLMGMTTGRIAGTGVLDRYGRVRVLRASMGLTGVGVLTVVFASWFPLVAAGALLWGLGTSLGFPVGMSAAADSPAKAAARVSVVSTIGYMAFLTGPPTLGFLGQHLGTLHALLLIAVLLVPAVLAAGSVRPQVKSAAPVRPADGSWTARDRL